MYAPDKLKEMHPTIVQGFKHFVSRNNYLPVMAEHASENFRNQTSKLQAEFEKDLEEVFELEMSVKTDNFNNMWEMLSRDKSKKGSQVIKLWNNKELIFLATRGRTFGTHLQDTKL